ncbi:hypothetical protein [Paraburkholderia sp. MM6662-R1]|uniref:hypothetical protein n=1 Tax=Paraburkholderia sp. MM6662-R1 TaxID=2991066 RepID=UPI003D24C7D2
MKTIIISGLLAGLLAACGSTPIVEDKEIGYMSRSEVSAAIQECEGAGQRATVVYAKARWRDKLVPVPVDVQCLPAGHLASRY